MSWLSSFLVGVVTSVVAAVAGGFVAAACVDWYRMSGREGASGYFVIAIVLLSCFLGFAGGLILSRFFGGPGTSGFLRGLGICCGAMLVLAAAGAALAWSLADIPPTLAGRQLDLLVEIRLPKGASLPVATPELQPYISMASSGGPGQATRARENGVLDLAGAHQVDGRWVIPGSAFLFTTRGSRALMVMLDQDPATWFQLPFPSHPGAQYEKWSGWLPGGTAGKPWPETSMSYRFRIQPKKTPEEAASDTGRQFAALTPADPLDRWFGFYTTGRDTERDRAIAKAAEARPADLASALLSPEYNLYSNALYTVALLTTIDPQVLGAMREMAADIETRIRKLNSMSPQQEGYYMLGSEASIRFASWSNAWPNTCQLAKVDCRKPVEALQALASAQKDSHMQEIVLNAEATLNRFQ